MLTTKNAAEENYRVKDLIDYGKNVIDLHSVVNQTTNIVLIGVVGPYGVGKSVMLNAYQEQYLSETPSVWIHYDAWKYPNRDNLWEGFVLDFVRQFAPAKFDEVKKAIDGEKGKAKTKLVKNAATAGTIAITGNLAFAPLGDKLGNLLAHFTETSPAKRVFEVQEILAELIIKDPLKRRIYIEVEDADRSGQAGIYFIETLNHFLKNLNEYEGFRASTEIKVIIPIARQSFYDKDDQQAYIKALDVMESFNVKPKSLKTFIRAVINNDILDTANYEECFTLWTEELLIARNKTIREVKFIIRNAESKFQKMIAAALHPDPLIVYMIESQKFLFSGDALNLDEMRQNRNTVGEGLMDTLIKAVSTGSSYSHIEQAKKDIHNSDFRNKVDFYAKEFDDRHLDIKFEGNRATNTITAQYKMGKYWLPYYYLEE